MQENQKHPSTAQRHDASVTLTSLAKEYLGIRKAQDHSFQRHKVAEASRLSAQANTRVQSVHEAMNVALFEPMK